MLIWPFTSSELWCSCWWCYNCPQQDKVFGFYSTLHRIRPGCCCSCQGDQIKSLVFSQALHCSNVVCYWCLFCLSGNRCMDSWAPAQSGVPW